MAGFIVWILAAVLLLGSFTLTKAEEYDGLEGFGKKLIGSPHGKLIRAVQVNEFSSPHLSSIFVRILSITSLSLIVLLVLIFLFSGGGDRGLANAANSIAPCVIIAAAFSSHNQLGLLRSLVYASVGFFICDISVIVAASMIAIASGWTLIDPMILNIFFAFFGVLGAALAVSFAPVHYKFEREFSDGFSDEIWVSNKSAAYKAFRKLTLSS